MQDHRGEKMAKYIREQHMDHGQYYFRVRNPNDASNEMLIHVTPDLQINAYMYRLREDGTETSHQKCLPCAEPMEFDFLVPDVDTYESPNFAEGSKLMVAVSTYQNLLEPHEYLQIECHLEDASGRYNTKEVLQWFKFWPRPDQARMTHVTRINQLITEKNENSFRLTHPEQRGTSMVMSFQFDEATYELLTFYTLHHGNTESEPEPVTEEDFEALALQEPYEPVDLRFTDYNTEYDTTCTIDWKVSLYKTNAGEWGIGSEIKVQELGAIGSPATATTKQYVYFPRIAERKNIEPYQRDHGYGAAAISVRSPFVFPARRRGGS